MDDVVEPGCRPTLRVLDEHLQEPSAWEDPEQIKAIKARNFRKILPLSRLSHCLIVAGRKLTGDEGSGQNLIVYKHSVTVGSPSVWRELKQDQWRGLVTQPFVQKEWWLVHAGVRREGDRSNVYRLTDSADKTEIRGFYPTQDDKDLLRIEKSLLAQQRWQSTSLIALIDEIARVGVAGSGSTASRRLPINPAHPGTHLEFTITLERFEKESVELSEEIPAEVFVSICIQNWADEVVRQAIIPTLMGFIDPSQENWEAYSPNGKTTTYSVLVSESRLSQIIASASIPARFSSTRSLRSNAPATSHAHYVSRDPLVDAFVAGSELQALCGCWFVPTKDHSYMPRCTECERIFATLA